MSHADFVHLRVHSAYSLSEGAIKIKELVGALQAPRACRRWRSPTPAICSAPWSSPARRGGRRPADHRLPARVCGARPGSGTSGRAEAAARPAGAAGAERDRLSQSAAAGRARPFWRASRARRRRCRWPTLDGHDRGADRPDRRARTGRSAGCCGEGQDEAADAGAGELERAVSRPALCRAAAPRPGESSGRPRTALLDLAYAPRPAAGRHQRRLFRRRRHVRGA